MVFPEFTDKVGLQGLAVKALNLHWMQWRLCIASYYSPPSRLDLLVLPLVPAASRMLRTQLPKNALGCPKNVPG
jgi:hypothetical protein